MHAPRPFRLRPTLLVSCAAYFAATLLCAQEPAKDAPAPPSTADALTKESPLPEAEAAAKLVENSVVKVFATVRSPELTKPWSKQSSREVSGTGVVIEGKRILTNAHIANYATLVRVQPNQSGDKFPAVVEFIAHGIDLAILKLEDESFFDTHPPLARATTVPAVKDTVHVYGFPTGGSALSVTKGIVSRVEYAGYVDHVSGLRIQIDAAINPGNSGGPALVGDNLVGIAYGRLSGTDNIGYIIPNEEIELLLKDIADGAYHGKPTIFDDVQVLENPALRAYLKLEKSAQGVLVQEPFYNTADYPLKQWDIITHIGNVAIDNEGMIRTDNRLRLRFRYLVPRVARNDKVPLRVIRDGKPLELEVPVLFDRPALVSDLKGAYPPYFICGPLVLSVATSQMLSAFSGNNRLVSALSQIGSPLITRRGDKPSFSGEQLVIVGSSLFPHKLSRGYGNPMGSVIESINGTRVKNLAHAVELIRDAKDEFLVFKMSPSTVDTLVFPRAETLAATDEILADNGIREQGSAEVMAIWKTKL